VGISFSASFLHLSGIIKLNLGGFNMTENKETTPKTNKNVPTLGYSTNGIMGSTTTEDEYSNFENIEISEGSATLKVALFSTRNVSAEGFGKLHVGYNILSKRKADFWLAQRGIRLATPEEVAEAFA
jgi:hypothetical protein